MKKRSKLIILIVSGTLLLTGTATFVTVKYRENVAKTQKYNQEQKIKLAKKIVEDKRIADKVIADKKIADKKALDKLIADKVEAQRIADEKARLTRIDT